MNPTAANVLRMFRQATVQDVSTGRAWYRTAHNDAHALAVVLFGTTEPTPDQISSAAAVIAVLSPSTPWQQNIKLAWQAVNLALDGASWEDMVSLDSPIRIRSTTDSAGKAAAIVLGADPASVVSGPKVTPFWQRIAEAATGATGPGSVVIDRHAFDVAVGQVTSDKIRGTFLGRKGGTHTVAMAYVRAAAVLRRTGEAPGITPSELQAVTWGVWRREHAHYMGKAQARREAQAA